MMTAVARRNKMSEADHKPEYLIFAHFGENEEDQGFWDSAWVTLPWLLEQEVMDKDEVEDAMEALVGAEEAARRVLEALASDDEDDDA